MNSVETGRRSLDGLGFRRVLICRKRRLTLIWTSSGSFGGYIIAPSSIALRPRDDGVANHWDGSVDRTLDIGLPKVFTDGASFANIACRLLRDADAWLHAKSLKQDV